MPNKKTPPKHFCILPWIHLNINPNGKVNACCTQTDIFNLGSVRTENLSELWNCENLKKIRREILNGELPEACRYCFERECEGFESDRQRANEYAAQKYHDLVDQTLSDGTLPDFNLRSLDIRFSNFCNLSCRICRPVASSGWYTDAKFLGMKHLDLSKIDTPTPGNIKLRDEVFPLLPQLDRIFFVGGEPLLQKDHYLTLLELLKTNNTQILIDYISNFTELTFGEYSVIDLWKKFPHVSVHISLDAIKERAELLRKGLCWEKFLKNLETVRKETPHVSLKVTPTVSIHNIFHIPDFIKYFIEEQNLSSSDIVFNLLVRPSYYSVQTLPLEKKEKVLALYSDFLSYAEKSYSQSEFENIKKQLAAITSHLTAFDNSKQYDLFKSMTQKLDFIRDEKFSSIFPEFDKDERG